MHEDVWAAAFVTGKRYHVHWGTALDFDTMTMTLSNRWTAADEPVRFHSTHIDVRQAINFYDVNNGNEIVANMTYFSDNSSGTNYVYNDTETREFGWRATVANGGGNSIRMEGIRCVADCEDELGPEEPLGEAKLWSDPTSWPSGEVPVSGDVMINLGENIIYDLEDSPIFDLVTVNGALTFLDDADNLPKLNLNAHFVYVRAG
jgi:hypothetical protein